MAGGKVARIKLVLIFDELDKMDFCSGVKPMLEGLKNLFLERNIVFLLVTSKQFYYKLLDARSVEDDPLSSYFSNIVHVPLLSFPQVRAMLDDWLDHRALGDFPRLPHETEFLDDLACYLTYHTLGNPREIIRMLREKQEWESAAGTPALTDAIAATPGFRVYAAIQEAIEQALQPGSAVFERFGRDQGVLEQIRRGLYIFTEKVIDRKVLAHDSEDFKRLHKDNFSLIPLDEAWGIAVETARLLEAVHQKAQCVPLFSYQPQVIRATDDFYAVTGRKAPPGEQTEEDILQRAEGFAALHGWPERNSALHLIGQIEPAKLSPVLKRLLAETLTKDENPSHRFAAARQLKAPILFADSQFDLSALLEHEKDSAVLGVLLSLVSEAPASERDRVVSALLTFLDKNTHAPGSTQQSAFKLIAQFADRDVTDALLQWFRRPRFTGAEVEGAALEALAAVAVRHQVDLAERIISDEELLRSFTDWALPVKRSLGTMLWEARA